MTGSGGQRHDGNSDRERHDHPTGEPGHATPLRQGPGAGHPTRIGPFRVISLIGEGGMGMVYEAEQDRPHRLVALKIVRPGMVPASALRRFELEYEFLGRLQHPGIAQIYQAASRRWSTARSRTSRWNWCAAVGSTSTCAARRPACASVSSWSRRLPTPSSTRTTAASSIAI